MIYKLKIGWLYPDLMSTYGDRGNILVLKKQCEWRNIEVEIQEIFIETSPRILQTCDVLFMGGAQDRQQKIAGEDFLKRKGPVMKIMIDEGVPGLFVCAAFQAVGHYYRPYQGADIKGPGILDLYTHHPGDQAKRLVGNVVADILNPKDLEGRPIVGFENHGGRTYLGPKLKPFARVRHGNGNNGVDLYEGAIFKNTIASYFHGPLLPKNPFIAKWLLEQALEKKYGAPVELDSLDEDLEKKAQETMIKRLL